MSTKQGETTAKPRIKRKSFKYNTALNWIENRAGNIRSADKPPFRVASPPEFKGEAGVWTPEDLLVAAVETCLMTTFMALAEREKLVVLSYESSAEGLLEFADGSLRFTRIWLRPVMIVNVDDLAVAEKTIAKAHEKCLISNSISGHVILEPQIVIH